MSATNSTEKSPVLYFDVEGRKVFLDTERVKREMDHLFNPVSVVQAEGLQYQEGGEYNLFILVKNGPAFIIYHYWYSSENGGSDLTSPLGTNYEKVARKDYDPRKYLTKQFHPNY